MERVLDKIFEDAYVTFFGAFFVSLFIFEHFNLTVISSDSTNGIFNLLSIIIPSIIALLTFFAVLSLHRLDKLAVGESSSQEIRNNLRKVGKLTLLFIFIFLLVAVLSLSDKNQFLQHKVIFRLDRIIISGVIAFSAYLFLSAGRSYFSNLKPKDN